MSLRWKLSAGIGLVLVLFVAAVVSDRWLAASEAAALDRSDLARQAAALAFRIGGLAAAHAEREDIERECRKVRRLSEGHDDALEHVDRIQRLLDRTPDAIASETAELARIEDAAADAARVEAQAIDSRRLLLLALCAASTLVVGVFVVIGLSRSLLRRLAAIQDAASRVADGDLRGVALPTAAHDELGKVEEAVQRMLVTLHTVAEVSQRIGKGDLDRKSVV